MRGGVSKKHSGWGINATVKKQDAIDIPEYKGAYHKNGEANIEVILKEITTQRSGIFSYLEKYRPPSLAAIQSAQFLFHSQNYWVLIPLA